MDNAIIPDLEILVRSFLGVIKTVEEVTIVYPKINLVVSWSNPYIRQGRDRASKDQCNNFLVSRHKIMP